MGCYVLLTYPVLACPDLRLYSAEHKNMRKMAPTTMIRLTHPTIAHTEILKHHIFDDVSDVRKECLTCIVPISFLAGKQDALRSWVDVQDHGYGSHEGTDDRQYVDGHQGHQHRSQRCQTTHLDPFYYQLYRYYDTRHHTSDTCSQKVFQICLLFFNGVNAITGCNESLLDFKTNGPHLKLS